MSGRESEDCDDILFTNTPIFSPHVHLCQAHTSYQELMMDKRGNWAAV